MVKYAIIRNTNEEGVMMLFIYLVLIALFLLFLCYSVGFSILKVFKLEYKGFELILGYLGIFGVFHLLSIIPIILNLNVNYVYFGVYPILILVIIVMFIINKKSIIKSIFNLDKKLLISTILLISVYFSLDFVFKGDRSFYLSLIRSTVDSNALYLFNPWTNNIGETPGYMYYFVTYEAFLGTLSKLFFVDSSIFTINVITIVNLTLIIYTTAHFLKRIFPHQYTKAAMIYLFIFIFLNSNQHRLFFSYNAFNIMKNITAGKTIYLHAMIVLDWILIQNIMKCKRVKDFALLGFISLIVPGLTASALYLQLMITVIIFIYFIYNAKESDRLYGKYILICVTPIILNYLLILFAPDFYITNPFIRSVIILFFIMILLVGLFLFTSSKHIITRIQPVLKKSLIILLLGLMGITLLGTIVFGSTQIDRFTTYNEFTGIGEMLYRFVYNLIIFYVLTLLSFIYVYQKKDEIEYRYLLIYFILFMLFIFINPLTFPLVALFITTIATYHRTLYIIPVEILIVYYLVHLRNKKQFLIICILIMLPGITIFRGMPFITEHQTDFYYKINKDVVYIGNQLNEGTEQPIIIGDKDIMGELPIVTNQIEFKLTYLDIRRKPIKNLELQYVYDVLNEESTFDYQEFDHIMKKYQFTHIMLFKDNDVTDDLFEHYTVDEDLSHNSIIVYRINP